MKIVNKETKVVERDLSQYNLADLKAGLHKVSRDPDFIQKKYYNGRLGALYSPNQTEFKVWAPTVQKVELIIFDGYYGIPKETLPLEKINDTGVYKTVVEGDCHGLTYRYNLTFSNEFESQTVDPYSKAVTVNGRRSVVVDLNRTNPPAWKDRMPSFTSPNEAIIYEMHVRDLTISVTSGADKNYRGKFLGLAQEGTRNPNGSTTGLDYLKELGVTHVELMPIFDFQTVDETNEHPEEYNWGYDPQNFDAPEGSYATDPYNPMTRITELKTMIQAFHDAGIRVIMDVVFNHVYQVESHSLQKTVPGYFFRYNEKGELTNGTGVGNDTASERHMMRKFIVESVRYWAEEYHIDGFRFDLMGIHDIETMNQVRKTLDEIDPCILVFGEGWDMYTTLGTGQEANSLNANEMPGIGHFNEGLRDALKGNDFDAGARGFINGAWYMEGKLAENLLGRPESGEFEAPAQLIQYVEAHDNFTLYDRLINADPELEEWKIVKRSELALAIILLSQGIPFIHAGQEFLRTKDGVRDSYNKPDEINQIDWLRRDRYAHTVESAKNLIALRKQEPLLRQRSFDSIIETSEILRLSDQVVALSYQGVEYDLVLIFNARPTEYDIELQEASYLMLYQDGEVDLLEENSYQVITNIIVPEYSATVLKRKQLP